MCSVDRFGEASLTYEDCKFHSTANLQWAVMISKRLMPCMNMSLAGSSVATGKIVNDYTVSLAKNGRMDDALVKYGKTRATYDQALNGLPPTMTWLNHGEFAAKFGCDMALIDLNIASIKSKKEDVGVVINSFGT